jgi:transcriptional regulator with XRE-family HTH domain
MDTVADFRPSELYEMAAHLNSDHMRRRAAAALERVIKERGHGAIRDLAQALSVSRGTIANWRPGNNWPPGPDQIWDLAAVLAATTDTIPPRRDLHLDNMALVEARHLFDLFFDRDPHAAAAWLAANRPAYFRCETEADVA